MNFQKTTNKDLYYTKDHEWIDFKGTVAYTGICNFKLLGFKEIHEIRFKEPFHSFKGRGEVIAIITCKDCQIEAHMPVDGKVIKVNEALLSGEPNSLLQNAEDSGWLAQIVPSQPYERKDLLLPKQYQMNGKGKYAK